MKVTYYTTFPLHCVVYISKNKHRKSYIYFHIQLKINANYVCVIHQRFVSFCNNSKYTNYVFLIVKWMI